MSRLLKAYAARDVVVHFTCLVTGLELVAKAPTTAQRQLATHAATKAMKDLDGTAGLLAAQRALDTSLVASCVLDEGQPLGRETVEELPDVLIGQYAAQVQDAVDRHDPEVHTLTDDEIDEFDQALKKSITANGTPIVTALEDLLIGCDISMVRSYILHMAVGILKSETSKSSGGSSA